jgi:glyoxylase-like metal-dependent hydrolase (beta-lactamase superfamily II)
MSLFSGLERFPFTIRQLNPSTHLIRETDKYSEFPHIYAKTVFLTKGSTRPALIVLSDTGCGTNLNPRPNFSTVIRPEPTRSSSYKPRHDHNYNLANFLRATINPNGEIPYLVITTHCHYDHILGLHYLPSTTSGMTTVLSSSHKKSFIVPRSNLAEHSLCDAVGVKTPKYDVGIWAHDLEHAVYAYPNPLYCSENLEIDTSITILHTPGHTPDSLTWYDRNERYIVVGDSFYERESPDTKEASEPPMPTIFANESDLLDWWDSLKKVIRFVEERNKEVEETGDDRVEEAGSDEDEWVLVTATDSPSDSSGTTEPTPHTTAIDPSAEKTPGQVGPEQMSKKQRVRLGAAHVTAEVDAEDCLLAMQDFMRRVLRNEIPSCSLGQERGEETCLWDEALGDGDGNGRFSVRAPLRIVEEGRKAIPKSEIWRAWVG